MNRSTVNILIFTGIAAVIAPSIHTLTDVTEWLIGGFSPSLLWANYLAFIAIPFLMIGLFTAPSPKVGTLGFIGALLYGLAFIYFSHTTLYAIEQNIADYQSLWQELGDLYTAHGIMMIVGGLAFGIASYKAKFFPSWQPLIFLTGVITNCALGILSAPEIFQTIGSALRNIGLIAMGFYLLQNCKKFTWEK